MRLAARYVMLCDHDPQLEQGPVAERSPRSARWSGPARRGADGAGDLRTDHAVLSAVPDQPGWRA